MTDERLEQILKEQLYTQFDTVGGLDPYITAMKIACAEAVEKGSIEFHKWALPAKVKMYQDIAGKENEKEEYLKLKNMPVEELYKLYLQDQNKKINNNE